MTNEEYYKQQYKEQKELRTLDKMFPDMEMYEITKGKVRKLLILTEEDILFKKIALYLKQYSQVGILTKIGDKYDRHWLRFGIICQGETTFEKINWFIDTPKNQLIILGNCNEQDTYALPYGHETVRFPHHSRHYRRTHTYQGKE